MSKPTKKPSAKIRRYIAIHEGEDFRGQNLKFKGDAVGAKYNELIRLYPKIDSLPEGERDALLSTYYNIKPSTFRNKFGRLLQNQGCREGAGQEITIIISYGTNSKSY